MDSAPALGTPSATSTSGAVLDGVRVVELGVWVAGPAAGGVMADWGADVIKVEPPAGDPMRWLYDSLGIGETRVPPYELDNRGKRSVVLDLATDVGRSAMEALLATADVFITNVRIDALERLGLLPEELRRRFPRLIVSIVTGYGMTGPERDRAGYDIGAFWARSAMALTHMPPDGPLPPALRSGVGDHVTGMTAVSGIMAALFRRERTGDGDIVTTSLLRTGIYCLGWEISTQLRFGKLQRTRPRERNPAPLINVYRSADGKGFWLLGLEQQRHWRPTLTAMDRLDLADDPRFSNAKERAVNCEALIAEFDVVFATRPGAEWAERFDANDVWWAPLNSIVDVIADPQAIASGAYVDMPEIDGEAAYRSVASPIDFASSAQRAGRVARLGEHTSEVLAELGINRIGESAETAETGEEAAAL
jgi:crotonobetainyl-CoA:carnitine CoA-transferase CaiB-like acyl-CoA transferase